MTDSSNGFDPRAGFCSVTLAGKIYVIGGVGPDDLQVFDLAEHLWSSPIEKNPFDVEPFEGEGTSSEVGGNIYCFGGYHLWNGVQNEPDNTVNVFDTSNDTWTKLPTSGTFTDRESLSSCVVNGKIYAIGGNIQDNGFFTYLSTVEVFDPSTNTWSTPVTNGSLFPRSRQTSTVIDGKIYVIGGENGTEFPPCQVFDPSTNTWDTFSSVGFLPREFATASVVGSKIYILGGSPTPDILPPQSTVQMYDPSTDTWTVLNTIGQMTARYGLASTVVDGKIYALGGYYDNSSRNTVEVFDPNGSSSVHAIEVESGISIFPNPTSGPIMIHGAAGSVEVTNVLGERVAGTEIREPASGDVELDLSQLPAGTYFARIETPGGVVVRRVAKE